MNKQTPNAVLLIEPLKFGFNEETARYNFLQQRPNIPSDDLSSLARKELLSLATMLRAKDIDVILVQDDESQQTPSSVFLSDWISFHEDSRIVAYPIAAQNRKAERRGEILNVIVDNGFPIYDIVDISPSENDGKYLHGTGSVVFDRINKVAYAAISQQTDEETVEGLAEKFGYFPVTFRAEIKGLPVFSTSLVLSIAENYAIVCLEAIVNADERDFVEKVLLDGGKELVNITPEQVTSFAGSVVQLESKKGKKYLLISDQAYKSLDENQIKILKSYNDMLIVNISLMEQVGGAGISSIVAGIFLPK